MPGSRRRWARLGPGWLTDPMATGGWPENWAARVAGERCPLCAALGKGGSDDWRHLATGAVTEVHLERRSRIPGYCLVVWRGRHVAEPSELDPEEASAYWAEVVATGRAIAAAFEPAKLNYFTLGNTVPHLHTHVVPRFRDDPAAGGPIPWDEVVAHTPMTDKALDRVAAALRRHLHLPTELAGPGTSGLEVAPPGSPRPPAPHLGFVARFEIRLGPPVEVGDGLLGRRRVIPIVGGSFAGPRLNGTVEPGGADWQWLAADGTAVIDTRYLLRTDDGAPLIIATEGYRSGSPSVLARLQAGEPVAPHEYYFRVRVTFDTGDERYAWLRDHVFVASAVRESDRVLYDAFLVE